MVGSTSALILLVASYILVPRFGLIGFGAAQVLQQVTMLAFGWLMLRQHIAGLGWLPRYWRRDVFVETTGYALKLNAIGVTGLLFEPVAKFAFNHAGGPGLVALFELASRLVTQLRMLVLTGAAPLSPAFAARPSSADPVFRGILEKAIKVSATAAVGIALAAVTAAPAVSLAVLGQFSPKLLQMNAALTAGWAINTLALPLYFAAQGLGRLRWNFIGGALITSSVLVGAFLGVPALGPNGLVAAVVVGLIASTLALLFGNAHAIGVADVVWRLRWQFMGASAAITILCSSAWVLAGMFGVLVK
jgi:O-antigen/teichoic acid export membrane protein